ncbi:MAG: NTP transferase domain-containing protein [Aerococcaceae bacterium]|nr:NTP transferase domain-containing protein [Aerococcaceae bacterium]
MNKQESDILKKLYSEPFFNQRLLAEQSGRSLGAVNKAIKSLIGKGYLNDGIQLTQQGITYIHSRKPKNAVILAAGFGMRMVPINTVTPKGLIVVEGETLIERLIKQLHEVGINKIFIVVGFMKDSYEFLIDEYGVELVFNPYYATKNNLSSLALVANHISNTYIVPCDIWCADNPFNLYEMYSWYMVSDAYTLDSEVKKNRKGELVKIKKTSCGNGMIGISYLLEEEAPLVKERLKKWSTDVKCDEYFWEKVLYNKNNKMLTLANEVSAERVIEINTYEQLRELDKYSEQLKSDVLELIADVFRCQIKDIVNINVLKKGMTNRSFSFVVFGQKYIMRIPGEGTERLINRAEEVSVFNAISGMEFCDNPIYIDSETGYKITKFLENVRVCNPDDAEDLKRCMKKLKAFHDENIQVEHVFDIFAQMEYYESLWDGTPSVYRDYLQTKDNVKKLKTYIDSQTKKWCLTHIDAIPDNFLFYKAIDGTEEVQLTDWEYAGMQDPHVDLAMFAIYSSYNKLQVDNLLDIYFQGQCETRTRAKIYCYISVCGLLWSNWCEFKRSLGVEFGEYSLQQYRYAKEYFKHAQKLIEGEELG